MSHLTSNSPDALQESLSGLAELKSMCAETRAAISKGGPEGFWSITDTFRDLVASDFLRKFLHFKLSRLVDDPHAIVGSAITSGINVFEDERLILTLHVWTPPFDEPAYLSSIGDHYILGVSAGALTFELYEQPAPFPDDELNRDKRLTPIGRRTLRSGEVLTVRAAYDIAAPVRVDTTTVTLKLAYRYVRPFRWRYDQKDLSPNAIFAADTVSSRIEFTAGLLSAFGYAPASESIESVYEHPSHAVRWAAIRALLKLDPPAGVRLLRRAVEDRHPHVRNAATRALERWERERAQRVGGSDGTDANR